MRILRGARTIESAIAAGLDPAISQLLSAHLAFMAEYEDPSESEVLSAVLVEPGDGVQAIDHALHGQLLAEPYSGKRYGDRGFSPGFETCLEHPTFYEMFFIEGEEGTSLIVPKCPPPDPTVAAIVQLHAQPVDGVTR